MHDAGTAKLQATGGMNDLSEEDEDFAMKSEEDDGGEPSEPDSEEDAEGGGSAQVRYSSASWAHTTWWQI